MRMYNLSKNGDFMNDINLNSLRIFLCVATSNSFLDASKKLYISQPAISKCIKLLEDELHTNLFYRGNKGIRLTPEGEKYLKYVMEANDLLETGKRLLTDENELNNGLMIIGAQSHIVRYYLLEIIAKFKKIYPNVKIRVIDLSTHELLESLEKHKVDLVIDSSPIDVIYNNVNIVKVATLDTCFIKSSKNKKSITSPKDLVNSNIILPLTRSSLRKTLEKDLELVNIKLNPVIEFETEELIIESVKRNLGVGFVVENAVSDLIESGTIKKVDINYELPKVEINAVYVDNYLPRLARIFLRDFIKIDGGK